MLCVDLFCGLGGWTEAFLAEGWDVIGFDNQRHVYGDQRYPAQLVLQDVLMIHGSQFRNADVIVASPPCQEYSYRSMPWKMAKALTPDEVGLPEPDWWKLPEYRSNRKPEDLPCMGLQDMAEWTIWKQKHPKPPPSNALFDACFRIQREASEAAGCHIPLIVENVKGAQPWVGRAKANYGSFYLWGDVDSIGGRIVKAGAVKFGMPTVKASDSKERGAQKNNGGSWFNQAHNTESGVGQNPVNGVKVASESGRRTDPGNGVRFTSRDCGAEGVKQHGSGPQWFDNGIAKHSSKSDSRKAASAQIAKIPFPLAQHIARIFKPTCAR